MNTKTACLLTLLFVAAIGHAQQDVRQDVWAETKRTIEKALNNQDYERALSLIRRTIETSKLPEEQAEAYIFYAQIATKSGDYDATDFYLQKAENVLEEAPSVSLTNQIELAKLQLQFVSGYPQEVVNKGKEILKKENTARDSLFHLLLNDLIGLGLTELDKNEEALSYFNRAIKGFERLQWKSKWSNSLQNKAFAFIDMGRTDSIEFLLSRSIRLAKEDENLELEIEGIQLIGKYYLSLGQHEAALAHLDIAGKRLSGRAPHLLETRQMLAQFHMELCEAMGNYKDALHWHKKNQSLKDSLHREDTALRVAFSESMQTIADQQSRLTRSEFLLAVLGGLLVLIAAILYVQRRNLRMREKMAQQLLEQNEALQLQRETLVAQKNFIESKSLKLETYLRTLEQLANSSQVNQGQSQRAFVEICTLLQESLEVGRVSIWDYRSDDQSITRKMILTNGELDFTEVTFYAADFPKYFEALDKKMLIIADDVLTNPATTEFQGDYITQAGITSMMDAPYMINGELAGIICCEHTGPQRTWQVEDTIFLRAMSDFISVTLLTEKIRAHNEALLDSNESLEDAVRMRTMELELQNKQLSEYAFINSHLLRAPLARILGLSDIMKKEFDHAENQRLLDSMIASADELDHIIKRIGTVLHKGDHLTRTEINKIKKDYPVD